MSRVQVTDRRGTRATYGHLAESPSLDFPDDLYALLQYEPIQNAIDVEPDQLASLSKARIARIRLRQNVMREFANSDGPFVESGDHGALHRALEKSVQKSDQQFEKILDPRQLQRLKQISLELRIQSAGIVSILRDPQMIAELQLSDEQLGQIKENALEASKEYDRKIRELKRQIRNDMISTLTDQQTLKLKSMLGKPFEWVTEKTAEAP